MSDIPKFCKDCKHFIPAVEIPDKFHEMHVDYCRRNFSWDIIGGHKKFMSCGYERQVGDCGIAAKWFEPGEQL